MVPTFKVNYRSVKQRRGNHGQIITKRKGNAVHPSPGEESLDITNYEAKNIYAEHYGQ